MVVLKLWSDAHRRTPVDIFVYEPFDFKKEYARAEMMEISPGLAVPVVSLETLVKMKRECGRPQDNIDADELMRGR